ncbi:MAG TPA: hypothetical protein VMT28_02470 [Terriglobales bacterium]|jgi:predicted transcriptional regulator|nr:hypothetical protein [Terriglobales bacterium]
MKTSITLKLDSDLLLEVSNLAADEGTSISALLAASLEKMVRERAAYKRAKERALARLQRGFDLRWRRRRSRDQLNDRLKGDD